MGPTRDLWCWMIPRHPWFPTILWQTCLRLAQGSANRLIRSGKWPLRSRSQGWDVPFIHVFSHTIDVFLSSIEKTSALFFYLCCFSFESSKAVEKIVRGCCQSHRAHSHPHRSIPVDGSGPPSCRSSTPGGSGRSGAARVQRGTRWPGADFRFQLSRCGNLVSPKWRIGLVNLTWYFRHIHRIILMFSVILSYMWIIHHRIICCPMSPKNLYITQINTIYIYIYVYVCVPTCTIMYIHLCN